MIKYTWDILAVTKKDLPALGLTGVVVRVEWKKVGTNKAGQTAEFACMTTFDPPTKANEFTNLDDLTDDDLIEWIKSTVDEATIDAHIAEQLAEAEKSAEEVTIPWVSKKAEKKSKKRSK